MKSIARSSSTILAPEGPGEPLDESFDPRLFDNPTPSDSTSFSEEILGAAIECVRFARISCPSEEAFVRAETYPNELSVFTSMLEAVFGITIEPSPREISRTCAVIDEFLFKSFSLKAKEIGIQLESAREELVLLHNFLFQDDTPHDSKYLEILRKAVPNLCDSISGRLSRIDIANFSSSITSTTRTVVKPSLGQSASSKESASNRESSHSTQKTSLIQTIKTQFKNFFSGQRDGKSLSTSKRSRKTRSLSPGKDEDKEDVFAGSIVLGAECELPSFFASSLWEPLPKKGLRRVDTIHSKLDSPLPAIPEKIPSKGLTASIPVSCVFGSQVEIPVPLGYEISAYEGPGEVEVSLWGTYKVSNLPKGSYEISYLLEPRKEPLRFKSEDFNLEISGANSAYLSYHSAVFRNVVDKNPSLDRTEIVHLFEGRLQAGQFLYTLHRKIHKLFRADPLTRFERYEATHAGHCDAFADYSLLHLRSIGIPTVVASGLCTGRNEKNEDAFVVSPSHSVNWWLSEDGTLSELDATSHSYASGGHWVQSHEQSILNSYGRILNRKFDTVGMFAPYGMRFSLDYRKPMRMLKAFTEYREILSMLSRGGENGMNGESITNLLRAVSRLDILGVDAYLNRNFTEYERNELKLTPLPSELPKITLALFESFVVDPKNSEEIPIIVDALCGASNSSILNTLSCISLDQKDYSVTIPHTAILNAVLNTPNLKNIIGADRIHSLYKHSFFNQTNIDAYSDPETLHRSMEYFEKSLTASKKLGLNFEDFPFSGPLEVWWYWKRWQYLAGIVRWVDEDPARFDRGVSIVKALIQELEGNGMNLQEFACGGLFIALSHPSRPIETARKIFAELGEPVSTWIHESGEISSEPKEFLRRIAIDKNSLRIQDLCNNKFEITYPYDSDGRIDLLFPLSYFILNPLQKHGNRYYFGDATGGYEECGLYSEMLAFAGIPVPIRKKNPQREVELIRSFSMGQISAKTNQTIHITLERPEINSSVQVPLYPSDTLLHSIGMGGPTMKHALVEHVSADSWNAARAVCELYSETHGLPVEDILGKVAKNNWRRWILQSLFDGFELETLSRFQLDCISNVRANNRIELEAFHRALHDFNAVPFEERGENYINRVFELLRHHGISHARAIDLSAVFEKIQAERSEPAAEALEGMLSELLHSSDPLVLLDDFFVRAYLEIESLNMERLTHFFDLHGGKLYFSAFLASAAKTKNFLFDDFTSKSRDPQIANILKTALRDIEQRGERFELIQHRLLEGVPFSGTTGSRGPDMREYIPGDSLRLINQRALARTGKLYVNLPESDEPSLVHIAVDIEWLHGKDHRMFGPEARDCLALIKSLLDMQAPLTLTFWFRGEKIFDSRNLRKVLSLEQAGIQLFNHRILAQQFMKIASPGDSSTSFDRSDKPFPYNAHTIALVPSERKHSVKLNFNRTLGVLGGSLQMNRE